MSMQPSSALVEHLERLMRRSPLSEAAQRAFLGLSHRREEFAQYRDIVREGEPTNRCCFVESGLVSRYKSLRSGGRQIVSFHLRGDLVDLQSSLVKVADHGIRTHTATTVLTVSSSDILKLVADHPDLGRALWFETLVDASIFREWTLNVGRRSGLERTAHLLLELAYRFKEVGLGDGTEFTLPITQADLSDALGLSPVHVNRSLQALRSRRLIRTIGKTIVIEDREALVRLADFHTTYLHPEGPRSPE